MTPEQQQLYDRIQAFDLDITDISLPFSKRLARDNGWSLEYAQRVIVEYKKFAFLAVVAGHPVTPSDAVDQAWHLHLLYTHSYWGEFCPNILQTPLHHGPTLGGKQEHQKFNHWYQQTLNCYEAFFGESPPIDIWHSPEIRFSRDIHFQRVNTQDYWVFPKVHFPEKTSILSLLIVAVALTGCTTLNPLNFTGSEFLGFYLILVLLAIAIATVSRWYLRKSGDSKLKTVALDAYETAYLAKDEVHAIDTALIHLVTQGYVQLIPGQNQFTVQNPLPNNSHLLEQAVVYAVTEKGGELPQIRESTLEATEQLYSRLEKLGLLISQSQAFWIRTLPSLGIFGVLGLGILKINIGISRDKPVGYLTILCILTAIIGLGFLFTPVYRSRRGDRILERLQTQYSLSPAQANLTLTFALWGQTALNKEPWLELRQVLYPATSSSSHEGWGGDSGYSFGGDSSGDGGGGCGGCGGCGGGGD